MRQWHPAYADGFATGAALGGNHPRGPALYRADKRKWLKKGDDMKTAELIRTLVLRAVEADRLLKENGLEPQFGTEIIKQASERADSVDRAITLLG